MLPSNDIKEVIIIMYPPAKILPKPREDPSMF